MKLPYWIQRLFYKTRIEVLRPREYPCPTCTGFILEDGSFKQGVGWAGHWYTCWGCGGSGMVDRDRVTIKYQTQNNWIGEFGNFPKTFGYVEFKPGRDKIENEEIS